MENLVYRSAEIVSNSFDNDERTFEISFSSEMPISRGKVFEILDHSSESVDLSHLNTGNAPLLLDHESTIEKHAGKIVRAWVDSTDRKGKALIKLGGSIRAEEVLKNIKADTPPNVSVGYLIRNFIEESKNSFRVTNWMPFEISFVALPADNTVGFYRSINFSDSVETDEENKNINNQNQSPDKELTKMEIQDNQVDVQALIAAERKRNSDIQSLAKAFSHVEDIDVLAERSISAGEDVASFQSQILEKMKNVRSNPITFGQAPQVTDNVESDPKKGFRNFKEYVDLVIAGKHGASNIPSEMKKRAAPSVYSNITNGPDGGYAIPEEFANSILEVKTEQTSLLQYANQTPITGNSMTFTFDPKQPWNGGVRAFWRDEAEAATQSKPVLNRLQLNLKVLTALCPVTDEMLSDSQAMATFLMNSMNNSLTWNINDAIINGNGSGQPTGILSTNALVAVAKETSQTADTILAANLAKMYGSMIQHKGNLIFIAHPDTLGQIMTLTLGDKPVWLGDFSQTPGGTLLGRPLVLSDACATLGDQGDIILADMSGYYAITKAGGAEFAQSMHLWFDQSVSAFRLNFRMDGSPIINEAITPAKGSNKRSFFATIAARA